jgi:hypothetical protein
MGEMGEMAEMAEMAEIIPFHLLVGWQEIAERKQMG